MNMFETFKLLELHADLLCMDVCAFLSKNAPGDYTFRSIEWSGSGVYKGETMACMIECTGFYSPLTATVEVMIEEDTKEFGTEEFIDENKNYRRIRDLITHMREEAREDALAAKLRGYDYDPPN